MPRRSAPPTDIDVESLLLRRDRRARARKTGTIVLSLTVGLAMVVAAFTFVRTPARVGPAAGALGLSTPSGLAMPDGAYLYRRTRLYAPSSQGEPVKSVWWANDGSGRVRQGAGDDTTFGPGQMVTDTGPLDQLSSDSAVLREQMMRRMAPDGASPEPFDQFSPGPGQPDHVTAGMIRSIGELLADPNTTPELRAALFRVAAGLDGVSLTRDVLDPVGRPAIELSVTTEERLHHWWFDPETQQLLAWQDDATSAWLEVVEAEGFTDSTTSTHVTADLVPAPVHDPS